jgi:hypothetical protein
MNSITKFAVDLLIKTIAIGIELHLAITRSVKGSSPKTSILKVEDFSQPKSLEEEAGPVASGPAFHTLSAKCGSVPPDDFSPRL